MDMLDSPARERLEVRQSPGVGTRFNPRRRLVQRRFGVSIVDEIRRALT
jgi:hypothetical protein